MCKHKNIVVIRNELSYNITILNIKELVLI